MQRADALLGIYLAGAIPMRLVDRRDTPLVAALLIGTVAMFSQPLRFLLSIAEEISVTYHVDLIPGLFVFVLVLTVHHRAKHRDTAMELRLTTLRAEEATRNAVDMAQLVSTSRALANALDLDTLRREALREIPSLVRNRQFCLGTLERGDHLQWIVEPSDGSADALAEASRHLGDAAPNMSRGGWHLIALRCRGHRVGLLGVLTDQTLTALEVDRLEALAAVLSVSIKNVKLFDDLKVSSVSDSLTGCFNKAYAFSALDAELRRAKRNHFPLAIVMLDVDGFKNVNDTYGHVHGDRMLASIGETLRRTLRSSDVKCRYGGDEFLAILPETPPDAANHVAEHLRRVIDGIEVPGPQGVLPCRMSVGLAVAASGELDAVALVGRADEALYQDKRRNSHNRLLPPVMNGEPTFTDMALPQRHVNEHSIPHAEPGTSVAVNVQTSPLPVGT